MRPTSEVAIFELFRPGRPKPDGCSAAWRYAEPVPCIWTDMPWRSCITSVDSIGTAAITTIEAVGDAPAGRQVQRAWLELEVPQCGYCQSGQIMSASALLVGNSNPTDADINGAMSGNICRCGTYPRIRAAIKAAAEAFLSTKQRG